MSTRPSSEPDKLLPDLQKRNYPCVLSPGSLPYQYTRGSSFEPQRDHWTGHSHCVHRLRLEGKGIASKCHHIIGPPPYPLSTVRVPDAVPDACVFGLRLDSDLWERKKASGRAGPGPGIKSIAALPLPLDGDTCCRRLSGDSEPLLEQGTG